MQRSLLAHIFSYERRITLVASKFRFLLVLHRKNNSKYNREQSRLETNPHDPGGNKQIENEATD